MGLPSSGLTAMYRNPMTEVCDFLNKYHDGLYKVYNLCTRPQDQYDPSKFGGNVASFPFADHGVPPLAVVDELAHSVQNWGRLVINLHTAATAVVASSAHRPSAVARRHSLPRTWNSGGPRAARP